MAEFTDSLRGYGRKIHERDNYTCRYCGINGKHSFEVWLTLTVEHLLPKGHPERNNPKFIVTACNFCNVADNHYFTKYGLSFDDMTPEQLVEQRKPYVHAVRNKYREFWEENVKSTNK